jgi:hypothetical protein
MKGINRTDLNVVEALLPQPPFERVPQSLSIQDGHRRVGASSRWRQGPEIRQHQELGFEGDGVPAVCMREMGRSANM